jgi:hypothetical protein
MKQTTEELKAIIASAPDDATHYDGSYYYIVNEDAHKSSQIWNVISPYSWHESGNLRLNDLIDMRSLADIKRIAELKAEIRRCARKEGWSDDHPLEKLRMKTDD